MSAREFLQKKAVPWADSGVPTLAPWGQSKVEYVPRPVDRQESALDAMVLQSLCKLDSLAERRDLVLVSEYQVRRGAVVTLAHLGKGTEGIGAVGVRVRKLVAVLRKPVEEQRHAPLFLDQGADEFRSRVSAFNPSELGGVEAVGRVAGGLGSNPLETWSSSSKDSSAKDIQVHRREVLGSVPRTWCAVRYHGPLLSVLDRRFVITRMRGRGSDHLPSGLYSTGQ